MSKITLLCLLILSCLLFCSCASSRTQAQIDCTELSNAVRGEILPDEDYSAYSDEDARYLFDLSHSDDRCLLYSVSSDDIGEFGILRAPDDDSAQKLLNDVNDHIEALREDKTEFVKRYMPSELSKLENASAKRWGRYVVYTVLDTKESDRIFETVSKRLK